MNFQDAIDAKGCLYATSEDHSEFCGKEREKGNRNYCAEHAETCKGKYRKPTGRSFSLDSWRAHKANEQALKARGIG